MFLFQGKGSAPARPTWATWGYLTGHHVRAAPHREHAAGPLSEARLECARWGGEPAGCQSSARSNPVAARLKAETPPERPGATRRGPHGGPRTRARASGGGAPLAPGAGVGPHPSMLTPSAPSPRSILRSFPASSNTRSTCRSSSPRHQVAKSRETSPLITRDFPQHGALERARDGAEALLLAAPRARALLGQQASMFVAARAKPLTFASFTMMAANNGGACGRRVAQMSPKEPNDVDGGRGY